MQISLYSVTPDVYLFECDTSYNLAMTFIRCQEFYENNDPQFYRKSFSLLQFMEWYATTYSPNGTFSYSDDFTGFNLPGEIIEQCYTINTDHNPYDKLMLLTYRTITELRNGDNHFYLIGVKAGDLLSCKHERAHGFFHTNNEYKQQMTQLVTDMPGRKALFAMMHTNYMYDKSVLIDEAQAYMATGLIDGMQKYKPHRNPFVSLFKKYDKKHSPQLISSYDVDIFAGEHI